MRAAYALISCLLLASWVSAEDLILGERNDDDFLVTNRFIFKPPIPNKPMMARLGVTAPENAVVTCVIVKNLANTSTPTVTLVKGDIGENALLLLATAQPGEGMLLEVTGYATNVTEPTTTAAPDTPTGATGGSGSTGDVVETTTPAAQTTTGNPDVPCDTEVTTHATDTPTGAAETTAAPPATDAPTTAAPVTTAEPATTHAPATETDAPEATTVAPSPDTE